MYCKYCGKKLKDGEKCTCPRARKAEKFFREDIDDDALFYDDDDISDQSENNRGIFSVKIIGIVCGVAVAVVIGLILGIVIPQKFFGADSSNTVIEETENVEEVQEDADVQDEAEKAEEEKKLAEEKKAEEKKKLEEEKKKEEEEKALAGEYILADSDKKAVTEADTKNLTAKQLNYAKNEIYARHGRKFMSKELQDYFNSKSWYKGTIEANAFDEGCLSQIERANIDKLYSLEMAKEPGGYQLDAN